MTRQTALVLSVAIATIVAAAVFAASAEPRPSSLPMTEAAQTIGVEQQRSDPNGVVFDPSRIRSYQLELSDDALAQLNADPTAEQYVPGAVTIDGVRYEPVGIRYKGFFGVLRACFVQGRQVCPKLAWKVKFSHYDPSLRFHGLKRLNFHGMTGDEAQMREMLSYQVFRDAGVAAPRSVFAELTLNGESIGLFTLTEDIDDRFIADRFRDRGRGVLYKEIWPTTLQRLNAGDAPLEDSIARGPRDVSGIVQFSGALQMAESKADQYEALLEHLHAPDDLFNYLAADRLTDNWDGIVAWYCVPDCNNHNFFWYQDALSGRFTLIPWDVEHTWRSPSPIREYYDMPDWDELDRGCQLRKVFWNLDARAPYCDAVLYGLATLGWERYIEASRVLLRETLSLDQMHDRIDTIANLIEPYVREDDNGPGYLAWQEAVSLLHREVDDLWAYIDAKIDAWDRSGRAPGDD